MPIKHNKAKYHNLKTQKINANSIKRQRTIFLLFKNRDISTTLNKVYDYNLKMIYFLYHPLSKRNPLSEIT